MVMIPISFQYPQDYASNKALNLMYGLNTSHANIISDLIIIASICEKCDKKS